MRPVLLSLALLLVLAGCAEPYGRRGSRDEPPPIGALFPGGGRNSGWR
jgi:hypothetical protein